jgi:hypothetical protein
VAGPFSKAWRRVVLRTGEQSRIIGGWLQAKALPGLSQQLCAEVHDWLNDKTSWSDDETKRSASPDTILSAVGRAFAPSTHSGRRRGHGGSPGARAGFVDRLIDHPHFAFGLGNYMATNFVTAADGHGGTLVTLPPSTLSGA